MFHLTLAGQNKNITFPYRASAYSKATSTWGADTTMQEQNSGGPRSSSRCTHPTFRRTIPPSVRPFTRRFGAGGVISGSELTTFVTIFGAEVVVAGSSFSFLIACCCSSSAASEVGLEQTFAAELPASCSSGQIAMISRWRRSQKTGWSLCFWFCLSAGWRVREGSFEGVCGGKPRCSAAPASRNNPPTTFLLCPLLPTLCICLFRVETLSRCCGNPYFNRDVNMT